jgi:hypothetical protein
MKCYLFLILLIIAKNTFSQDLSKLQNQIDSLNYLKNEYTIKLQSVDNEIKQLEERKTVEQYNKVKSFDYLINQKLQILIRDRDNSSGRIIFDPKNGETVKLLDYDLDSKCWTVSFNNNIGYVNEVFFQGNSKIEDFKNAIILKKTQNETEQKQIRQNAVKQGLKDEFGAYNYERIQRHEYWIGMTDIMARASLGSPDDINRSTGSWGIHEQWIYKEKDLYLYFENDILTSFQNK